MPGRVGDSPIIGAGTYANNESCGVSATANFSCAISWLLTFASASATARFSRAANDVVMKELVDQHGEGGVIAWTTKATSPRRSTPPDETGTVRGDGKISMKRAGAKPLSQ